LRYAYLRSIDDARFARFRQNPQAFAREALVLPEQPVPSAQLEAAGSRMFGEFF
jgi:hypothetical protein